ncbi:hypothetical protein C8F01DRAFT_1159788 [Mycena amicta]|nr:hypothetical protein C8F01DRAFT_1159788 [Mycena amicta]
MAALFLHNSLWVPDPDADPQRTHGRTTSSSTLQTLQFSESSHPTQPLLHSATSEAVAYLDLLSRQPTHPSFPRSRGAPAGLSFDGDPTTLRERKTIQEQTVRRRLRRLQVMMRVLEVIIGAWAVYTTVRYFLAYAGMHAGQTAAIILAVASLLSFAVLVASIVVPYLQTYILGHNKSDTALFISVVRLVLRYGAAVFLLAPSLANFVLVVVWRDTSSVALNTPVRCNLDIDVVWSIHAPASCSPPPWELWLTLAIIRLLLTVVILTIYLLSLASYDHTRRPSRHRPNSSSTDSAYFASPPMSASGHHSHHSSTSTLTPAPERRSLRSSRRHSNTGTSPPNPSSPRSSSHEDEFDPYADLPSPPASATGPSDADRELYSFVDRFRSLVSQVSRETADGVNTDGAYPSSSQTAFLAAGAAEFGMPVPVRDDRVLILNSYIRRMPTIESLGSREVAGSVAGSSVAGDYGVGRRTSIAASLSMSFTGTGGPGSVPTTPTLSRTPTLSMLAGASASAVDGPSPMDFADRDGRPIMRRASNASASSAASSSFFSASASVSGVAGPSAGVSASSPMHTPIAEEPPDLQGGPSSSQTTLRASSGSRPLPRPPSFPPAAVRPSAQRTDSV